MHRSFAQRTAVVAFWVKARLHQARRERNNGRIALQLQQRGLNLQAAEAERGLQRVDRRLKPGASFVTVHPSAPHGEGERDVRMSRYAAFLTLSGAERRQAAAAREKAERELTILSPARDEALLRDAGFGGASRFHMGCTFRGWIGCA